MPLQSRQHAGENLEAEVFFVAQSIGSSLEHADFVVEAFDETERDLVFRGLQANEWMILGDYSGR